MVENITLDILKHIFDGGPKAIVAILLGIIGVMYFEIRRLRSELQKKDERIDQIVDDYYKGNVTLTEALNSLKLVLFEVKARL